MTDQKRPPVWETREDALPLPVGHEWAPQEHWAWARILRGELADMSDFDPSLDRAADFKAWFKGKDDGAGWKANEEVEGKLKPWPEHRRLSEPFMRQILFQKPYAEARARPWVRIQCAVFDEELVWENETFDGELGLYRCRFDKVNWLGLRIGRLLHLNGSRFTGALEADRLAVGGNLFCRGGFVAKSEVSLVGARVGGQAAFTGATLEGALQADGLVVAGDLFCRDGFVAKGEVRLVGGRVGGTVAFIGATLESALQADRLAVEGNLYLRQMERLSDASFIGARIKGDLQLSESKIEGVVDLTNASIEGELQTSQGAGMNPKWDKNARLILRNATLGALAGGVDSFPTKPPKSGAAPMELAGLTYARLGGLGAGNKGASSLALASKKQLTSWLAAGHPKEEFTPGPYQQLAAAFVAAGDRSRAIHILHARRLHERACQKPGLRKLGLVFYGIFVGFGFKNLYGVIWFLLFVALGAAYGINAHGLRPFEFTTAGWDEFWRWIGFSLGNSIPLIQLDKAHETFLAYRFANDEEQNVPVAIAWAFYGQKAAGFLVLSYFAAGLTSAASRDQLIDPN